MKKEDLRIKIKIDTGDIVLLESSSPISPSPRTASLPHVLASATAPDPLVMDSPAIADQITFACEEVSRNFLKDHWEIDDAELDERLIKINRANRVEGGWSSDNEKSSVRIWQLVLEGAIFDDDDRIIFLPFDFNKLGYKITVPSPPSPSWGEPGYFTNFVTYC